MKNNILIAIGIFIILSLLNLFITPSVYWPLIGNSLLDETSIPQLLQLMVFVEVILLLVAITIFSIKIRK